MTRVRAVSLHLSISAGVGLAAVSLMVFVWYPPPLFTLLGGFGLVELLVGVDVVLGPLLTLVVFKSGKKGLKFDLSVIALMQILALAYGMWTVFAAKPGYIVFSVDRFELVRAVDVEPAHLAQARDERFRRFPLGGPEFIGAQLPEDRREREELLFSSLAGGPDIPQLPKYYVDLDAVREAMVAKSLPLQALRELNPEANAAIDRLPGALGRTESELGFLPLRAQRAEATVIVDRAARQPVRILELRPWQ